MCVTLPHRQVIRLPQMHEMQTIVTDVCGVCQSVCLAARLHCVGSFGAAFAKLLWPVVKFASVKGSCTTIILNATVMNI